jgi:hypothetical protein
LETTLGRFIGARSSCSDAITVRTSSTAADERCGFLRRARGAAGDGPFRSVHVRAGRLAPEADDERADLQIPGILEYWEVQATDMG